jgi:CheY-like chemotaxis protein
VRRSLTILLVDHDDRNRVTFQVVLRREGYELLEAVDTAGALETVRDAAPDLIIASMNLARNSSLELLRTVRSDGAYKDVRILAVGEASARADALAEGADAFLETNANPQQLVKTVADLIGRA